MNQTGSTSSTRAFLIRSFTLGKRFDHAPDLLTLSSGEAIMCPVQGHLASAQHMAEWVLLSVDHERFLGTVTAVGALY
jgi:hypothetical protein